MTHDRNISLIRKEFFELYEQLRANSIIKDDIISMGNLALFVDYSFNRYKWKEKKRDIEQFANKRNGNEVNMLLAQHLYDISIRLELSDNLNFKFNKMKSLYRKKKLTYFDFVLDDYDFPDWFKNIMAYSPKPTKKELYSTFRSGLAQHSGLVKGENQIALAYFIDKFYEKEDYLFFMTELDYLIHHHSESEISWFLAENIFSAYFPEMGRLNKKIEQQHALDKLEEYKKLFQSGKLNMFNLFSEVEKERYLRKDRNHIS